MAKKFDLEEYKKSIKVADTPLKPDKFVKVNECLQETLGLDGIPLGHITMCHGKSDVGKCLSLDSTLVITSNGITTLGEAITNNSSHIENKQVGYYLNDGYKHGRRITFSDNSFIEGTNVHRIKVLDKDLNLVWKKLEELEIGDYIPNVTSEFNFNNKFDSYLAELMGWIISEGKQIGPEIVFNSVKTHKYELLRALLQNVGVFSEVNHLFVITEAHLKELNIGKLNISKLREIPEAILKSNKTSICSFLRGLFTCNGSVVLNQELTNIIYSTPSYILARQLQFVLKSLGMVVSVDSVKVQNYSNVNHYEVNIKGDLESLTIFRDLIGFSNIEKQTRLESRISNFSKYGYKRHFPFANELIKKSYRNNKDTNLKTRKVFIEYLQLVKKNTDLCKQRWLSARNKFYIDSETREKIDSICGYTFVKVSNIEDWAGIVGDPHIPEDNTYFANNLISHNTSMLFHLAAQAQDQGILPVIVVTEGKVDWNRAASMGFKRDFAIVNEECEYLEDVFTFIDKITMDVSNGDIPYDCLILFDSIGNTLSKDEVKVAKDGTSEKKGSNMKAAKCISEHMRYISRKINDTRKITYPKSVGLFIINQSYTTPSTIPGLPPALTPYGGTAVYYRSSLVIRMSRKSKLKATKSGKKIGFGIVATITVDKNHISNLAHSGSFVITEDAILPNLKASIEDYKTLKAKQWGESLVITVDTEDADGELDE